jgi:hypothetical protein
MSYKENMGERINSEEKVSSSRFLEKIESLNDSGRI